MDQILFHRSPRGLLRSWELNIIYIQLGDPNPLVKWKGPIKQLLAKLCQETLENGFSFYLLLY
jgi:hypothetical protein